MSPMNELSPVQNTFVKVTLVNLQCKLVARSFWPGLPSLWPAPHTPARGYRIKDKLRKVSRPNGPVSPEGHFQPGNGRFRVWFFHTDRDLPKMKSPRREQTADSVFFGFQTKCRYRPRSQNHCAKSEPATRASRSRSDRTERTHRRCRRPRRRDVCCEPQPIHYRPGYHFGI